MRRGPTSMTAKRYGRVTPGTVLLLALVVIFFAAIVFVVSTNSSTSGSPTPHTPSNPEFISARNIKIDVGTEFYRPPSDYIGRVVRVLPSYVFPDGTRQEGLELILRDGSFQVIPVKFAHMYYGVRNPKFLDWVPTVPPGPSPTKDPWGLPPGIPTPRMNDPKGGLPAAQPSPTGVQLRVQDGKRVISN